MRWCDLVHPDQRELVRERGIARARGEDVPSQYEMPILTKDGREKWVDFSAVEIEYRGIPAIIGTLFDVTERKKAEAELRWAQQEKYNQAKEIAGGIGHEVYNALFPVTAALDKLRSRLRNHEDGYPERDQKLAELAETATFRAIKLTEEVTSFSKLESETEVEPLELRKVLDEIIDDSHRIKQEKVEITTEVPEGLTFSMGRVHAFSLFNNMINNALDALLDSARKQLSIRARQQDGSIRVEIEDTGTGIEPDILPRIFNPFFSTKPRTGTGLGLAICSRIVDIHGGSISVESDLDRGTKFVILLQQL